MLKKLYRGYLLFKMDIVMYRLKRKEKQAIKLSDLANYYLALIKEIEEE